MDNTQGLTNGRDVDGNEAPAAYDAIVLGGGAAGLSGALMLARQRRRVVVIDDGQPRNAPAAGVHGLLGHDGIAPAELLARGRAEVTRYGGEIRTGTVTRLDRTADDGFTAVLADGAALNARRLLVATGLVDELPDVPGLAERWGRDVVHCPYCHGYEVRDRALGVLGGGPMAVHQALLFRQLSDDVVFLAHGAEPDDEQARLLAAKDISVVPGHVAAVEVHDDRIAGVRLDDGTIVSREVLVVGTRMVGRAGVLADLGLAAVAHPSGMGEAIAADGTGRTSVPGVWAAGNITDLSAQVGAAAAAGAMAGAQINADLVMTDAQAAAAGSVRDAQPSLRT